jgi:predicted Ser/Thr protein kinase
VIKTRRSRFRSNFFKIIELLEEKASVPITPTLHVIWKCDPTFYLLYSRIDGEPLYEWKGKHAMDHVSHFSKLDDQTKKQNLKLFNIIMQRLLIKLKAMHQLGIFHGDHEGNVLIDDKLEVWIIDFDNAGLSSDPKYHRHDFIRLFNRNRNWLDPQTGKEYLEYLKQLTKDGKPPSTTVI